MQQREIIQQRLAKSRLYHIMQQTTSVMDRYWLDALIGLIPGWGDVAGVLSALPFLYFSVFVIRSLPLTLAVLNNALRDVLLGMLPFFVGDVIDVFHRSNVRNMQMIDGFVQGDQQVIRAVNRRALQTALACLLMLLLIGLMVWLLVSLFARLFG